MDERTTLLRDGWRKWNDHPGYTIHELNIQLDPFGLKIDITERTAKPYNDLWFKVVRIKS